MRKLIVIKLLFLVVLSNIWINAIAEDNNKTTTTNQTFLKSDNLFLKASDINYGLNAKSDECKLAILNLQVDVLGVLFFGPQVSLDLQIGNFIAFGPDFTWHYAGFLFQGFMTEFFSDGTTIGMGTYGIGGHMKFLIPAGSGFNRPYVGFGYEKFIGEETYEDESLGTKFSEYRSNVLHFDLGYKRLTEGSFNFSVGLSIAVSKVAWSGYYYESNPDDMEYYEPGETMVFPLLQLAIGWQIGPH